MSATDLFARLLCKNSRRSLGKISTQDPCERSLHKIQIKSPLARSVHELLMGSLRKIYVKDLVARSLYKLYTRGLCSMYKVSTRNLLAESCTSSLKEVSWQDLFERSLQKTSLAHWLIGSLSRSMHKISVATTARAI